MNGPAPRLASTAAPEINLGKIFFRNSHENCLLLCLLVVFRALSRQLANSHQQLQRPQLQD